MRSVAACLQTAKLGGWLLDQCPLQGLPPHHRRGPCWPGVRDETCKQLQWKPAHGHVRHVARPVKQAAAGALSHIGDTQAPVQMHRGDALTSGVIHGDPTHGKAALFVEGSELGEFFFFTEARHLAEVEKNSQHEDRVNLAPEGLLEGEVAKHASSSKPRQE